MNPRNSSVLTFVHRLPHWLKQPKNDFLPRDVFIVHRHFELPLSFIELRFTEACLLVNKADYYIFFSFTLAEILFPSLTDSRINILELDDILFSCKLSQMSTTLNYFVVKLILKVWRQSINFKGPF